MGTGFEFKCNTMKLTVLAYDGNNHWNVALLQRESDGAYISVCNLLPEQNGDYTWGWGNYFPKDMMITAYVDFIRRCELFCH